ncbi:hypothetical protein EIP86_006833 [Pleurotus ostreatoroseus]|nr:hypothetical protein EIP86_006833 [Pleurotus ostreatoroseus]
MNAAGQPTPKVGGSPRTMLIGIGTIVAGFAAFSYAQVRLHKNDNPTWIIRHGQQPGNNNPNVPQHGPRIVGLVDAEPRSHPSSVPLPGDGDKHAGGFGLTTMSAALGKGIHPDPFVPENPGNIQQPAPQRRNSSGTHYTKAGYYAESYKGRPEDPTAPKEGRS